MKSFNDFKEWVIKYCGAIIGGLVAIVLLCTGLFKLLLILAIVVLGVLCGNYIQKNKEAVKEKLKKFIDKF